MSAIWSILADCDGNPRALAEVCEEAGAALRRGWDSAAPSAPEPAGAAPDLATLRARIAELEEQIAGLRVERIGSAGECVTGDGVRWSVVPGRGQTRADYVFVTVGITEDGDDSNVAGIPIASLLRACGRSDL